METLSLPRLGSIPPAPLEHRSPLAPSASPKPSQALDRARVAFRVGLLAIPSALGLGWAIRSRRTGLVAGGLTALALAALRWQMARWFTPMPAYEVERRIAGLELRRYPTRIEARTEMDVHDFEHALDRGFGRLACYLLGANAASDDIAMTTPALVTMRDGRYTLAFAMPPGRGLGSLPTADDPRVELRELPAQRIATLAFRGRFTRDNVEDHERELLRRIVDAGLVARGSVAFAVYDSPATLPPLRRNELWIEIV